MDGQGQHRTRSNDSLHRGKAQDNLGLVVRLTCKRKPVTTIMNLLERVGPERRSAFKVP